jgi:hypothetical protein
MKKHATKTILILSLSVLFTALTSLTAVAQTAAYTPEKGSAERKAISDALRVPVEKKLKQSVVFKIDHLKVKDGWAFMLGTPRKTDGGQIDYSQTIYAEAKREGMFDDNIMALLHKVKGRWRVVQYVIGATDVAYIGWDKKYGAPSAIFPG